MPRELLYAIIANEMIDYSKKEFVLESWGVGSSVGPAQITAKTVLREGFSAESESDIRKRLLKPAYNIDIAGRLLRNYIDILGGRAEAGEMTASFLGIGGTSANASEYVSLRDSSNSVGYDVSAGVLAGFAGVWNNGPRLIEVSNIESESPNAWAHGGNASLLDGQF